MKELTDLGVKTPTMTICHNIDSLGILQNISIYYVDDIMLIRQNE